MRVAVLEVDRAGERVDRVGEPGGARALGLLLERQRRVDERGVDDAAVAAGALGAVERAVGEPHQALLVARVARELGDAGAEREAGAALAQRRVGDRGAQPLDDALGAPRVGVGQREQELVAADPPADVAGPQLAHDHAHGHPQRLVAGAVADGVVELLEVVDVEHDDGDLLAMVGGVLERVVERVVEPAMVEHAGQRVLQREPVDPRLQRLGHAAERVDRPRQHADLVAPAPAERRPGLAGHDEQRVARDPVDRPREQQPAQQAGADDEQQAGAEAREQHLAAARGERGRALLAREVEPQDGDGAAAVVEDREAQDGDVLAALVVGDAPRVRPRGPGRDGDQLGMGAAQAREPGADPLDVVEVARRQRAREAVRDRLRLRLAVPAVGVADRVDRAVGEEAAADEHQQGRPGDDARL